MTPRAAIFALILAACSRPNPVVCCSSEEDCSSIGISDSERTCALGLTCRDHECQIPLDAPRQECVQSSDCGGATPVCAPDRTCVECVASTDCPSSAPACDPLNHTCRGCGVDVDCDSGACDGVTGLCIAESSIAYASPAGSGTAPCSKVQPCSIQRAFAITDITRDTVKMTPGTYTGSITVANKTVNVHGDGATISSTSGETLTVSDRGRLRVSGLIIVAGGTTNNAVNCESLNNVDVPMLVLDRVQVESLRNAVALYKCVATITRSKLRTTGSSSALFASDNSTADVERSTLLGGGFIVGSANASLVRLTNSVIANPTSGDDAFFTAGGAVTVSFSTIINARGGCGNGAAVCSGSSPNGVCYDNSIVANLVGGAPADSVYGTACVANFTLVYPQTTIISGSSNKLGMNPLLSAPGSGDFHLLPGSPAIDAANPAAPVTPDHEGLLRPQGAAADMGAFEFTP